MASAHVVSHDPHFFTGWAIIKVKAEYYAGGALAESDVDWEISSSAGKLDDTICYAI